MPQDGSFIWKDVVRRTTSSLAATTIERYEYDGWNLTYRSKTAQDRKTPTLLLVHPVGIGLNSWFWKRVIDCWPGPVLAPDLIGCGIENGGDGWVPSERGLSFPLGWVRGCEALLKSQGMAVPLNLSNDSVDNTENSKTDDGSDGSTNDWLQSFVKKTASSMDPLRGILNSAIGTKVVVVAQGGLAPVGVMLAARNPSSVSHLVLTSPPTWKDMTTAIPEKELKFNFDFLSSPVLGRAAFALLESRWAVEFFSNAFLFGNGQQCDKEWLDRACSNTDEASRPPTMAFNAGLCNHRSFEEEMTELSQSTLILSGTDDKRFKDRVGYVDNMQDCTMLALPGQNVLPWECPEAVCDAILAFVKD